jgi:NCAIR mutase (PurE)-related protein
MIPTTTREILEEVRDGKLPVSRAEKLLKLDALTVVEDIARLDHNRQLRRGVPEIIYSKGKTTKQLESIISSLLNNVTKNGTSHPIFLSKVSTDQAKFLKKKFSNKRMPLKFNYYPEANIVAFVSDNHVLTKKARGKVALISAGTSDIGVLNEAEVLLRHLGCQTIRFNDVGIAALRRLSSPLRQIEKFDPDCIIIAAGMEGALPSLIAGLSSVPVIGLPTSVGYGYGRGGEAALMSMLQACPLGICVVNIDGGIAAGTIAWLIANRSSRHK